LMIIMFPYRGSTSCTLQDEASSVIMLCYNMTTAKELGKIRVEYRPMGPSEQCILARKGLGVCRIPLLTHMKKPVMS
jgi:hypothetical protein